MFLNTNIAIFLYSESIAHRNGLQTRWHFRRRKLYIRFSYAHGVFLLSDYNVQKYLYLPIFFS